MNSNAIEFLNQIESAEKEIALDKVTLSCMEQNRTYVKAARTDRNALMAAYGNANYEKVCDKVVDLERKIDQKKLRLVELRESVIALIESIPSPVHARLLELRYIEKLPFTKIAPILGYSRTHVYRLHSEALDMLGEAIDR